MILTLQIFIYLQLLDFLTTMVGLKLGLSESSPFIRWAMEMGPTAGLALSKLLALGLAGICVWRNKGRLVRWINYWYAALVVWNLSLLLLVRG